MRRENGTKPEPRHRQLEMPFLSVVSRFERGTLSVQKISRRGRERLVKRSRLNRRQVQSKGDLHDPWPLIDSRWMTIPFSLRRVAYVHLLSENNCIFAWI